MKLLRNIATLTGLCASMSVQAAAEFDNGLIPLELVREINGGTYYRTLPDDFPVPQVPAALGLGVIGSVEQGVQQQVLLRNTAAGQAVRDALQAAYVAQGWITLQANATQLTLCHDQHGTLRIRSNDAIPGNLRTHVSRIDYPDTYPPGFPGTETCAQQLEAIESGVPGGAFGFFQSLMPVLEVPEGTVTQTPVPGIGIRGFSGSFSGDSAEVTNDGTIEVPAMTTAEMHQHFALQLQDQGWVSDSEAVGERSTSSVWYKTAEALPVAGQAAETQEYTLVVTLLNTAEDLWRISVKLQTGNGNSPGFNSAISGTRIVRDPF